MATAQEIQQWLAANQGASDPTIGAAMRQYGVTPGQLASATGMDPTQVQSRYSASLPGVDEARTWLNGQLGGGYDSSGQFQPSSVFDANGVYDSSNRLRNDQVLGKAQQMGYNNDQISQILGLPADQIAGYQQSHQPGINTFASVFQHDVTNPSSYMMGSQPSGAPASQGGTNGPQQLQQLAAGGTGSSGGFGGDYGSQGPGGMLPASVTGQAGGLGGYTPNPYLNQIAGNITTQVNNNLQRNLLPGIRSGAVANGQVGSSREGIAQGLAMGDTANALSGALGTLYGGDYTNQMNRNLQQYQGDQSYNLGLGNLALGNQGQMLNFYNQGRQLDQSGAALGGNLYDLANRGGWTGLLDANNIFNQTAGNNTTSTAGSNAGGGWGGAIGGLLAGGSLAGSAGWWK
jgi:hypothetical protein